MEEQTNNFIGGLNSDFNSQNQPPNTYRSAQNWVRGLDGSLSNEMGTTVSITGLPPKKVLGSLSLEDDLILFFQNDEIGYVRNNIYTSIKVDPTLAFTTKLSVKGKINYRKDRVVYFVDGVNEDKILTYNTTSTLTSSISSLSVTAKTPVVKFLSVGDTGVLPTGVYQMSARLLTASGNKATVSLPTNPIPIINETTGRGADGAPPQTPSFKSINIEIINVDPK